MSKRTKALEPEKPTPGEARPISFDDSLPSRISAYLTTEQLTEHLERLNTFFPVNKPEFAERDLEQLTAHQTRYQIWQLGMTWQEIAEEEAVDFRTVRRSCFYFLKSLSPIEQIQVRNAHSMNRAHNNQNNTYFETLAGLFKEKSWMARSSALKHWRHTTGMEGTSVVSVNVDARKQVYNAWNSGNSGQSFEQAMDRVRRRLNEDNNAAAGVASDGLGTVIEAQLVPDDGL